MKVLRMFMTKKLTDIYSAYLMVNRHIFARQNMLDTLCNNNKKYKVDNLQMLDTAIADKDIIKLGFCIAVVFREGIDKDYSERFYKIILDTWHEEHEDIVDVIYDLKDERFCEPLLKIAMNKSTYRKFDDENESILRKCVHALKAINTEKSKVVLKQLTEMKNPNVQYALDMYR